MSTSVDLNEVRVKDLFKVLSNSPADDEGLFKPRNLHIPQTTPTSKGKDKLKMIFFYLIKMNFFWLIRPRQGDTLFL